MHLTAFGRAFPFDLTMFAPPAKSKTVIRLAPTGSVTCTFAQLFSSDKLSMARKVKDPFALVKVVSGLMPVAGNCSLLTKWFLSGCQEILIRLAKNHKK